MEFNRPQKIKLNPPFLHYLQYVLKLGDKPPRGKFFRNRIAGKPGINEKEFGNSDEVFYTIISTNRFKY